MSKYLIGSEDHEFHGRIYDLSQPLHLGFESWEQVEMYPEALYVLKVHDPLALLGRRVGSLNVVVTMLRTKKIPHNFSRFPLSRYQWLNVITDVFLMRVISVSDCAALLVKSVFQSEMDDKKCSYRSLSKAGVDDRVIGILKRLSEDRQGLREERNLRFHRGWERELSDDDQSFRMASSFEHWGQGIQGEDSHGRPLDVRALFREARTQLNVEVERSLREIERQLNELYGFLLPEFNRRFRPMMANRKPLPWE